MPRYAPELHAATATEDINHFGRGAAGVTTGMGGSILHPMLTRYDMRRDENGWTVFDIWTGWPALIKDTEQTGLDIEQADDLVDLLNSLNERREPLP